MCGIVGAIRREGSVVEGLIEALRILEYRGYDSAGVAVVGDEGVRVCRRAGRIEALAEATSGGELGVARAGIGHTRWATHGPPTDANAHPHSDPEGRIALVHNGIIENFLDLRKELEEAGSRFQSDTDTEVLAHLVGKALDETDCLSSAVRQALQRVRGYYAIAVVSAQGGEGLVCARHGPPLCIGSSADGVWLASDVLAILPHTKDVIFLEDGDIAQLSLDEVLVHGADGESVTREPQRVEWEAEDAGKGGYPHFMLKEIHEQPDVLARSTFDRIDEDRGDVRFEDDLFGDESLRAVSRIQIAACGTALHAGYIARYMIENLARVPVDCEYASEFRYREPVVEPGTLVLGVSQSGETADTLAAMRLGKKLGARLGSICNSMGSTMVREAEGTVLIKAGPEIGVASTKAFVAMVAAAYLLAVRLGRARGVLDEAEGRSLLKELRSR